MGRVAWYQMEDRKTRTDIQGLLVHYACCVDLAGTDVQFLWNGAHVAGPVGFQEPRTSGSAVRPETLASPENPVGENS